MKLMQHLKFWPFISVLLYTPAVFAHSSSEIGGGFAAGFLHQLSSWHHLAGLFAIFAIGGVFTIKLLRRNQAETARQRSRSRRKW